MIGGLTDCHTSCMYQDVYVCLCVLAGALLCVCLSLCGPVDSHLCRKVGVQVHGSVEGCVCSCLCFPVHFSVSLCLWFQSP